MVMRTFNEPPLGAAVKGLTGISKEEFAQMKRAGSEKILTKCVSCGEEKLIRNGKLHKYYKNKDWRCYDCSMAKKAQDKKEMNQALINLARSKGLIK